MDKSILKLQHEHLRIELFKVNLTFIERFWNGGILCGTFWCLYWNDLPGAGIFYRGEKVPLDPEYLYLLPPDANLKTFCDSPLVRQLYCHFYLPGYHGSRKILPVPLSPLLHCLRTRALEEFDHMSPQLRFTALSMIAEALHAVPPGTIGISESDPAMESIRRHLQFHLGAALNVVDLARQFHMPEQELSKRFQAAYNLTPYRYLSILRYEHAAMLLRSTEEPIEAICEAIGCHDRNYFTRCFKRRFGAPPAAYRRDCFHAPETSI